MKDHRSVVPIVLGALVDLRSRVLPGVAVLGVSLLSACGGGYGYGDVCGFDAFGNPLFCGGGFCGYDAFGNPVVCPPAPVGASSKPVAARATFAAAQALANAATQPFFFAVSGRDAQGNTYLIDYSSVPGPVSVFDGRPAATAVVTQTLYQNGIVFDAAMTTNYFGPHGDAFLGSSSTVAGGYEVAMANQDAPSRAAVGESFPLLSANLYRGATRAVLDGTLTETLNVEADSAATALLCRQESVQLTANGIADNLNGLPTSTCLRIDSAGDLLGLQLSVPIDGSSLTFR